MYSKLSKVKSSQSQSQSQSPSRIESSRVESSRVESSRVESTCRFEKNAGRLFRVDDVHLSLDVEFLARSDFLMCRLKRADGMGRGVWWGWDEVGWDKKKGKQRNLRDRSCDGVGGDGAGGAGGSGSGSGGGLTISFLDVLATLRVIFEYDTSEYREGQSSMVTTLVLAAASGSNAVAVASIAAAAVAVAVAIASA
ncbi:hypothetical protein HZH66_005718 [Vespula vulgaris]|uniref:Uncharacterized protein n=1 Tax=Vespula vulgaris TaxID=7454 RepID=A0A834NA26_VESVU|nr:hypothetical protein HZH66_005718 [Vespula vulgaris]